jgi:pimeloyl-ACP methyl ester carboxylesterase
LTDGKALHCRTRPPPHGKLSRMWTDLPGVEGVEHRAVTLAGVRVHVAESGAGRPLVLLHGWPQHWYCWRHLIPLLAPEFRLICPDLRGFGWSDAPPGAYDKEQFATDLLGLLDELGLDRVGLIGHDWGAWTGFLACLREPERFDAFLALGITTPFGGAGPRSVVHAWRLAYQVLLAGPAGERLLRTRPGFVRRLIADGSHGRDAWTAADLDTFALRLQDPDRAHASMRLYRTFLTRELPAVTAGRYGNHRLRVPTRLIAGEGDPVIRPSMLRGLEAHADDIRVSIVPDCGHFVPEEQPQLVAATARELFG